MNPKGSWPKNAKDPWPKNAKGPWPNNLVRKKALEQQIWNEIESSHFALPLHTQPGCYITVPSCSARVTLKEHTPRAISHVRLALGNVHCDAPLTEIMFALCSNIMFISCLYCPKVYILLRECASQCQTNVYLTRRLSSLY